MKTKDVRWAKSPVLYELDKRGTIDALEIGALLVEAGAVGCRWPELHRLASGRVCRDASHGRPLHARSKMV